MLDQSFEALKTYHWGIDPNVLKPIDEAVVAAHGNADACKQLEMRLAGALISPGQETPESLADDVARRVNDYICRKLRVIGTAASVPALAELLPHEEHSHMARYALERIPAPEAAQALRDALPKLDAQLKIGVISSLGARQDNDSVEQLAQLLGVCDAGVAPAAALALGAIRSPEAAKALADARSSAETKSAITDASLSCAESLLADGQKTVALAIYKGLASEDQPKHVRLAATRGMLACAGKKS